MDYPDGKMTRTSTVTFPVPPPGAGQRPSVVRYHVRVGRQLNFQRERVPRRSIACKPCLASTAASRGRSPRSEDRGPKRSLHATVTDHTGWNALNDPVTRLETF